jgi:hypothetical protein
MSASSVSANCIAPLGPDGNNKNNTKEDEEQGPDGQDIDIKESEEQANSGSETEEEHFETEAVLPKLGKDPGLPTQQEREAHRATHLPYRVWSLK